MGKLTSLQYLPTTLSLSNEPSGAIRTLKRKVLSIVIASTISAILFLLFFSPNHLRPASFRPSAFFSSPSFSSNHLFGPAILKPIQIPYDPHLFGLDSPVDWNQVSLSPTIAWLKPSQWPILLTSNKLLKISEPIPIHVFPRVIELDDRAPLPSDLIFGMTTNVQRASGVSELWPSWLGASAEDGQPPLCVIVLPRSAFGKGDDDHESPAGLLAKSLKDQRGLKSVRLTSSWLGESARYESRYFGMLREMEETARQSNRQPKWFIVSDDDTLWTDERMLRRELANYDPDQPWLLGASSEGISQIKQFGSMAFGGAGIIMSRGMCKKMLEIHADCVEESRNVFGGDEMYSLCAARAVGAGKTKETVVTQLTSLHQLDLPGDGTGFFQSGFPFMSLHHLWHGWTDAFAREHRTSFDRPDNALNHLLLLQQAARILGGDNFMRRSVHDNGRELLTLGYTVTRFDVPLKPEDMGVIEKTWSGDSEYPLRFPTRPRIIETEEVGTGGKRTYYLCEIRTSKSDPQSFTLVHRDRWGNLAEIFWKQD